MKKENWEIRAMNKFGTSCPAGWVTFLREEIAKAKAEAIQSVLACRPEEFSHYWEVGVPKVMTDDEWHEGNGFNEALSEWTEKIKSLQEK